MTSIFTLEMIDRSSVQVWCEGDVIQGIRFMCRLPDCRGSHLSCIEHFEIAVNGIRIPPDRILFCLNGKKLFPSEFPGLGYEYWRIDEPALICVTDVDLNSLSELTVRFGMRVPYAGTLDEPVVVPHMDQFLLKKGGAYERRY